MNAAIQNRIIPVKAIHRAYLLASRCQCDITTRPQVTVREMMPRMMKSSTVIHSPGSRGGVQVRSRPWMVWHCRTRPKVKEPPDSPMLIQSGLATLAIAKMSAARKRHPDITVSLSMSVNTKGGTEGDGASRSDLNPHVVSHHCGIWPVPHPRPLFTLYLIPGGLMSMHGVISLCCSS